MQDDFLNRKPWRGNIAVHVPSGVFTRIWKKKEREKKNPGKLSLVDNCAKSITIMQM